MSNVLETSILDGLFTELQEKYPAHGLRIQFRGLGDGSSEIFIKRPESVFGKDYWAHVMVLGDQVSVRCCRHDNVTYNAYENRTTSGAADLSDPECFEKVMFILADHLGYLTWSESSKGREKGWPNAG